MAQQINGVKKTANGRYHMCHRGRLLQQNASRYPFLHPIARTVTRHVDHGHARVELGRAARVVRTGQRIACRLPDEARGPSGGVPCILQDEIRPGARPAVQGRRAGRPAERAKDRVRRDSRGKRRLNQFAFILTERDVEERPRNIARVLKPRPAKLGLTSGIPDVN